MSKNNKKELSTFHLGLIIVVLLFVGVFILISSGLFDTESVRASQYAQNNLSTSSVNMNTINEINSLEEVVNNNPDNLEALLKLGHMLNDNGFNERAIEKYKEYLNKDPQNIDVIVDMGVCYFELKNFEKSINVIKNALEIEPEHQIANFNLGIVYFASGKKSEAKKMWKKTNELDPNSSIGKKAEKLLKLN